MPRVQDVTNVCFKGAYDHIKALIVDNDHLLDQINSALYEAERRVMLELIKREAVENSLTERVFRYAECSSGICDELTGGA